MANGFLTSSPGVRHGNFETNIPAPLAFAQKFTCPGTGTQEIPEIGAWVSADSGQTGTFRLAIFTHDAANNNPDIMVANSESAALSHNTTTVTKKSHTYSTKPQLTGGTVYWLAAFFADAKLNFDSIAGAGVSVYTTAPVYPTWPTAAQWDAATDDSGDFAIYAVYQAAVSNTNITPTAGSISASGVASRNDRGVIVPTEVDV